MKRGTMITLVVVALFVGLLAISTLRAQRAECEVCVEFNGARNCATASAASEDEAAESAQRTACGPLANGMNESIACGNTQPKVVRCPAPPAP